MGEFRIPKQLEKFDYLGEHSYTITIFTYRDRKNFMSDEVRTELQRALRECASKASFEVVVYSHLPSKVRMLVRGTANNSDLRAFVETFKRTTEKHWRKERGEPLWLAGYYDHVLRRKEAVEEYAEAVREDKPLPFMAQRAMVAEAVS